MVTKVKNLIERLTQLIPTDMVDNETAKLDNYLKDITESILRKEEIVNSMRKELRAKYKKEVDLLFDGGSDPDNSQVGSLENFVPPRFLKEDRDMELQEVYEELKNRKKGLLIEGQAGTGKTSISW